MEICVPTTPVTAAELRALFTTFFPAATEDSMDGDCQRLRLAFTAPDHDMPRLCVQLYIPPSKEHSTIPTGDEVVQPLLGCARLDAYLETSCGRRITDPANDVALHGDYNYLNVLRRIGQMDMTIYVIDTQTFDRERFIGKLKEMLAGYNIFKTRWSN